MVELLEVVGLAAIIGDTPSIIAAVIDSLPNELAFLLVGPRKIAFLRHAKRCRGYFDNDLSSTEQNKSEFVRAIQQFDSGSQNLLLIPVDDPANRFLHSTDKLNTPTFPVPDSRSFETLNDKWQFYQLCSKLGVNAPKTIWLGNKSEIDFELVCAAVGLPFVLKPTNRCDGLGVQIIHSKDDLQRKVVSQSNYKFSPLIAQTFVPGLDIDMSALVDRGRIKHFAIQTRKKDALWFVKREDFVKLTETVVSEVCYTGAIHIDARLDHRSGEIFLVEANPRLWASLADATAGGLNFVRAGIYASAGLEGPDPRTLSGVSVPSVGKMLAEIATFRRSYFKMALIDQLRLRRCIRSKIRRVTSSG